MKVIAYIGLGSNQNGPEQQLLEALKLLDATRNTRLLSISPIYESQAIGPEQDNYLNAVCKIETTLSAPELLSEIQRIELQQGRQRSIHWGPRTLDLDIILYGDVKINTESLIIPHPGMLERNFVLQPLFDIAGDISLPNGSTLKKQLDYCPENPIRKTDIDYDFIIEKQDS